MQIDFSKGMALHRMYGHYVFSMEARKGKKTESFINHICKSIQCDGESSIDWRNDKLDEIERRFNNAW